MSGFCGLCLGLSINLLSSVVIVLLNKWIYINIGFPNVSLTLLHFIITFIGLVCCQSAGVFRAKRLPFLQMLPLALSFAGFVLFTNLSLQHNTVGTYQLMKVLTTPCIICIETIAYAKRFSRRIQLTLVPITVGVILNSFYDIQFNIVGTLYAVMGVLITSCYQVWVGEKQKELQVNPIQLLYYQAPLSATFLVPIVVLFEPIEGQRGLLAHHWTMLEMVAVVTSGIIAFSVNLSIYWIIGTTSPVTYNMVGHLKFCMTLIGGYLLFQEQLQAYQFLGVVFTVSGVMAYTRFKLQEAKQNEIPLVSR